MTALVEPPKAISRRKAFSTDWFVITCDGVIGWWARRTSFLPDSSAATRRAELTAGIAAVPGSDIPKASAMQAIVLAVPMTAQVPAVTDNRHSISDISAWSISPTL